VAFVNLPAKSAACKLGFLEEAIMDDAIDYFFSSVSPFAWLGHRQLMSIAGKHGKKVRFRPVNLMGVWEVSGSVPLGQRTPLRQRYRLIELQRIAIMRGLHLNPRPAHFPTNPELADRTIIALTEAGRSPADFAFAVGEALWSKQKQIADEPVIAALLKDNGFDPVHMLELAKAEHAGLVRENNTKAAIEADAIGSPCYVYKGEPFWGQDRLDHLDQMITSGREAIREM
jgi:2-hydroxychromene-2-carboxylate isomerase